MILERLNEANELLKKIDKKRKELESYNRAFKLSSDSERIDLDIYNKENISTVSIDLRSARLAIQNNIVILTSELYQLNKQFKSM